MNSYHNSDAINSAQVKKLTNTKLKYIKGSVFRISLADFEIMLLGNTFRSQAMGAVMLGAAALASLGTPANAQEQVARAPAGQPVVTQPVGKHVVLRVGPGFNIVSADSIARILEQKGCTAEVTPERGLPKRVTVEVGPKKFAFTEAGSAGASALDWCLGRS